MSQYTSDYPNVEVDPAIRKFFENFYAISDTPDAHEKYAQQFTKDATFIIASKEVHGYDEIVQARHGMWAKVASRIHKPLKVFPFGPNADEVMLFGTVEFGFKAGGNGMVPWAARAKMAKEDGEVKMSYYQVYLDTAAMVPK